MVMKLSHFNFGFPADDWARWPVGAGIEAVADDLALRCADGPDAQAVVRRSVIALNADALTKTSTALWMAIWVPDRSTGEGMAVLDTFLWGFPKGADPSAEAFVARRNLKKDMGRGSKVFDYDVGFTDVPAGRAVTEVYTIRMRHEKIIQGYILFSIFPPGSANAFCLQISTVHLDQIKELAGQMRIIAQSVELTLWDAPA
jgi:hypothetical protein